MQRVRLVPLPSHFLYDMWQMVLAASDHPQSLGKKKTETSLYQGLPVNTNRTATFQVPLVSITCIKLLSQEIKMNRQSGITSWYRFIRQPEMQHLPLSTSSSTYSTRPGRLCCPMTTSREYLSLPKPG